MDENHITWYLIKVKESPYSFLFPRIAGLCEMGGWYLYAYCGQSVSNYDEHSPFPKPIRWCTGKHPKNTTCKLRNPLSHQAMLLRPLNCQLRKG